MMLRWLLLATLLAGFAAASVRSPQAAYACHPDRMSDIRVNLDRDPAKEEVVAAEHHNCSHTEFEASVHLRDRCQGIWRTYDLQSEGDVLQRFRIVNADGRTKRPEVFFVTRRLGPVARGIAEVVRLDSRRSACPRAHALFRYEPTDPALESFDVELKDIARQFPGLEVIVTEGRVVQHVTRYRYDRARDRYVVYG